ncbi:PA0069 family radical SAM protein [Paraburkholderia phenazinium]|jgi:DNA repair photolyase|uniref:DNA repair photolyase n=1 Tax=Paraburkholderia phenazinium TaxID=60549 RepID=A0A1N6FIL4_9BURK|nr:PA0069 family radical SAM protein [Paraburkholderia phenazinium]SIN95131.1 DNA repair photolyase [Paraburkholderia phenazinium]
MNPQKGRGSVSNATPRFESHVRETVCDEWSQASPDEEPKTRTVVFVERAKTIISSNQSPDIPFEQSVNAYRGCEHGCVYCYARPSHAYLNLSPGLDFETKIFAKENAAEVLRQTLEKKSYEPKLIALGTNTDPYQPLERKLLITESILKVLEEFNNPVAITTKSALVTRDIEILARMAQKNLARVFMSVTTLDRDIARTLEPRASTPSKRLEAIRELTEAGIPTGVMVAPIIPALTDHDMEKILEHARAAGAMHAAYVALRLPLEVTNLFQEWLEVHHPLKAKHVMSLVRQMRGGKDYDSDFRTRMRGSGIHADLIQQRFKKACARLGLNESRRPLTTELFRRPIAPHPQMSLF